MTQEICKALTDKKIAYHEWKQNSKKVTACNLEKSAGKH